MKRMFLVLLFFANVFNIYSMSVDSLLNEAFNKNPLLKSYKYKMMAINSRGNSVSQLPPPTLGVEFNQVPTSSTDILNNSESNSIFLSQMFMLGGKLGAMRDVELKGLNVEQANLRNSVVTIVGNLKMNYYNLWLTERKIEIERKSIDLLKQLINNLYTQFTVGKVNQADILSLNSEVYTNQTSLINLENERIRFNNEIKKLVGVLSEETIRTDSTLNIDISIDEKTLQEYLIAENPSLARMKAMIDMNQAMIKSTEKAKIPDLMVQGMWMRMPLGMPLTTKSDLSMLSTEAPKTEYMYSIMASITLPFMPWSSGSYNYKEEELQATIKGIEYEKDNMQNEMISQLKNSVLKFNTAKNLYNLYTNEVIPAYQQALNAQVVSYQTNRTNIASVLDSFRMLLMQQMNYYMAQADMQMAAAEAEMMAGSSIINTRFDSKEAK